MGLELDTEDTGNGQWTKVQDQLARLALEWADTKRQAEHATEMARTAGSSLRELRTQIKTVTTRMGKVEALLGREPNGASDDGVGLLGKLGVLDRSVNRLMYTLGRWPTGPDDTGSGLLGRVAQPSRPEILPVAVDVPSPSSLPPPVQNIIKRAWAKSKWLGIAVAVVAVLGMAGAQAWQLISPLLGK